MAYLGRKGASAALTSADIPDSSITTAKLIDSSVTSAKIGVDVIVAEDIANNAITVAELADNAVTQAKLADDAVGTDELANDVVINTSGAITTTGAFTSVGIDDNADALAITIDSSERVGIGTATPSDYYADYDNLVIAGSGHTGMTIVSGTSGTDSKSSIAFADGTSGADQYRGEIILDHSTNKLRFQTAGATRMTIDDSGNVGINTTAPDTRLSVRNNTNAAGFSAIFRGGTNALNTSNDWNMIGFGYAGVDSGYVNAGIGNIYTAGSGASDLIFCVKAGGSANVDHTDIKAKIVSSGDFYTNDGSVSSLSDVRVKKDIEDLTDGLDIVNQLRPRTFKYNGKTNLADDNGTIRYGFIADEVLDVAEQYVQITTEEIDGVTVNDFKALSVTRFIPMLTKAIQELSAKVTALETANNALEARILALENA